MADRTSCTIWHVYTDRVAISNHRLIAMEDGKGTFRWKDYAHRAKKRKMIVAAKEFIRRFLAVEEEPLVE